MKDKKAIHTSTHLTDNILVEDRLNSIRIEIDKIDRKLLEFLNKRAGFCKEVGQIKAASKEDVFKPFRENHDGVIGQ